MGLRRSTVGLTFRRCARRCGPCSRCSGRFGGRIHRRARCRSTAGRRGSPSDPADSGHTAGRRPRERRRTDPSAGGRMNPASPEGRSHTLQARGKHTPLVSEAHTHSQASAGPPTSAAAGSELERGRSAAVAVPPDHVGTAPALAAAGVAHGAERALRVTLAFWEMESNKGEALELPACSYSSRARA